MVSQNDYRTISPLRPVGNPPPPAEEEKPGLPMIDDLLFVYCGTFGVIVGVILQWMYAQANRAIHSLAIDADAARPTVALPDSTTGRMLEHDFYLLPVVQTLSKLPDPFPSQVAALLRGWKVRDYVNAGVGGIRGLTTVLFLYNIPALYKAILRRVRALAKPRRVEQPAVGDIFHFKDNAADKNPVKRVLVMVIAGNAGGVGSALSLYVTYLIRRAFKGLPGFELEACWLLSAGPTPFLGLHQFVLPNWLNFLWDLTELMENGLRFSFGPGYAKRDLRPPYEAVFYYDDPSGPAEGEVTTEAERLAFAQKVAGIAYYITSPEIRRKIAARLVDPKGEQEDEMQWLTIPGLKIASWNEQGTADYASSLAYLNRLQALEHVMEGSPPLPTAENT